MPTRVDRTDRENRWERIRIWGALLLTAIVVLLVAKGIVNKVQDERREATLAFCEREDRKHVTLFHQNQAKREVAEAAHLSLQPVEERAALLGTLASWTDCKKYVAEVVH